MIQGGRFLGLLVGLMWFVAASAQSFPSKPVTLVVPYAAGGSSDQTARLFGATLSARLGQQVIIENLGGASGSIAARRVLNAPADGYTLFMGSPNEIILGPLVNATVKLSADDFVFVQPMIYARLVLLVRGGLPVRSVDDFVALARKSSDESPLTYASVGNGSLYHLVAESMGQQIGAKLVHVPYKGGAPALQDLAGGRVDFAILPYQDLMDEMENQNRIRVLAEVGDRPLTARRELPALSDGQGLGGFRFTIWAAFMVRKGTPGPVVESLRTAIGDVLADEKFRAQFDALGKILPRPMSPQEGNKFIGAEVERYRSIAQSIGLKPE